MSLLAQSAFWTSSSWSPSLWKNDHRWSLLVTLTSHLISSMSGERIKIFQDFCLNDAFITSPPEISDKERQRLSKQDMYFKSKNSFTYYPKLLGNLPVVLMPFLDVIASPSTYPCQWVSQWVTVSDLDTKSDFWAFRPLRHLIRVMSEQKSKKLKVKKTKRWKDEMSKRPK